MKKAKRVLCAALAAVQAASLITFSAAAKDEFIRTDTIAVGDNHSLVIKSDLSLWAAGDNSHGQLGAGASVENTDGVKVMDNVVAVDANGETSFAIDTNGDLYGWGNNTNGQIDPAQVATYIYQPTKVMENVISVSAGDGHTVVITTDGEAYGWGSNEYGELGFEKNTKKNGVVKLMAGITDIAAGDDFTFLVTDDGKLYASGNNNNGQLGMGNYRAYTKFATVPVTDVVSVESGSSHTLVLKDNGTVFAAGLNDHNQVSAESKTRINSFTQLGLSGMGEVFAGECSSAAVNSNGSLFTWGDGSFGQLHDGASENVVNPKNVATGVVSIAFGGYHSIMLKKNGVVSAAGEGMFGELFSYTDSSVLKPERVLDDVTKYAAGKDHAAAIVNGDLYTWGNNDCGQLGLGDLNARSLPTMVDLPGDVINVWCGDKVTFAQIDDLRVYAFGNNADLMLGMETKNAIVATPKSNIMLADYKSVEIECGNGFCIALLDGEVYGWGVNTSGRLCDAGKRVDMPVVLSSDLSDVKAIAAGDGHCLALDSSGILWGWGSNGSKQLADSIDELMTEFPVEIYITDSKTGENVLPVDIDAAGTHSMVVSEDGRVWTWGGNASGQLGTEGYRVTEPTAVVFSGVLASAGRYACAIIKSNERLLLCGSNKFGALGDGTEQDRSIFEEVTANSAASVDLGEYFGGYIRGDGVLFCWGDNSLGQVGNGKGGVSLKPREVITDALCSSLEMAEGITLDKQQLVLKPNTSAKLTATITPSDADVKNVKWSSSNIKVATVASDGTVKAVAKGEAVITATTANGIKAECKVTVTIPVSSFSVSPSKSKTLNIGQSFTFKTKIYPSTAIDKTLLYESSDPSVAKVSAKGKVTAVSAGTATITVTAKSNPEKTRTVTINVRPAKTKFSSRKATADGVLLKWKAVNGADGYTIYRRTSTKGASTVVADVETGETLTCLDANAKSGKTYYYFIRAYIEVNGKKIYCSSYSLYKIKAK